MKALILTHKADIDGLSPVIFLKLITDDVEMILLNPNDISPRLTELIKTKAYQNYDEIYVTDLSIDQPTCDLIMSTGYDEKFHTFDHHAFNLVSNNYPFGTAISVNSEGVNESATSLIFKYLKKRFPETFDKPALEEYTELVRSSDTWDWVKTKDVDANNLSDLLPILGRDEYISFYVNFFKSNPDHFRFDEKQKYLLEVEEKRVQRYIEESERTMFHATLKGHPCGIVFAELHRSMLGNYLAEKYAQSLDFIVIINMQQGLSFRSIKDGMDVGQFATIYGGGGHVRASGAPLDNSLKKEVIKLIMNDKDMFKPMR